MKLEEIFERLKLFLERNVGSSVCVRSRDDSLLSRVQGVVAQLTKEYLIFEEPSIDDVRQTEQFLFTAPADGVKVAVLHRFERSSIEAINAFLKTLEEPPVHGLIVLTCVKFRDLPQTVRSRVKVFDLLVPADFYNGLREKIPIEPDLIISLCKVDFDVAAYVKEDGKIERVQFEPSSFFSNLKAEKLGPEEKIRVLLMLNDLFKRFMNGEIDDKKFAEICTVLIEQSKKIDLNRALFQISSLCEVLLEHHGVKELSIYRWFDSILRNKLLNFNGQLTLVNLLIKLRRSAER